MKNLLLVLALFALSCKTSKEVTNPPYTIPPLTEAPTSPSLTDDKDIHVPTMSPSSMSATSPEKPSLFKRIFSPNKTKAPRKVKYRNVTFQYNTQNASGGSTIGASSQTGSNTTKAKNASLATSNSDNTAGQGSTQEVKQTADAKNTTKKGSLPWWLIVGALAYLGVSVWRKSLKPWRWIV